MHREEDGLRENCVICGVPVAAGIDCGFAYGASSVLCQACAVRRGGIYDALRDRWEVEPDLGGLPDERAPHR